MKEIWVFVEHHNGRIRKASFELLSECLGICEQAKAISAALIMGSDLAPVIEQVSPYVDVVYKTEGDLFSDFLAETWTSQVSEMLKKHSPALLLASATQKSRDFLPAVAARLKAGLITEATGLSMTEEGRWKVTRPFHGGRVIGEMTFKYEDTNILTFRPNSFPVTEPPGKNPSTVDHEPVLSPDKAKCRYLGKRETGVEAVELTEADVIVAGGRGMRESGNFFLLEDLAKTLQGAVGASRAVVDSGWRGHHEQVGKSGKTVSPTLYFACGISGAIHHILGMDTSKVVVAINRDPDALIFNHADIGIVGDALDIVPRITEKIKTLSSDS